MQKYKCKLTVGIPVNLIHKKTKKAATSKLIRGQVVWNSQGVAYKGSNDPNGTWTKQCNQQLKEIHFFTTSELTSLHLVSAAWPESTVWHEVSVILATPSNKNNSVTNNKIPVITACKTCFKREPSGNALVFV